MLIIIILELYHYSLCTFLGITTSKIVTSIQSTQQFMSVQNNTGAIVSAIVVSVTAAIIILTLLIILMLLVIRQKKSRYFLFLFF